jgi:hypothetical protein
LHLIGYGFNIISFVTLAMITSGGPDLDWNACVLCVCRRVVPRGRSFSSQRG